MKKFCFLLTIVLPFLGFGQANAYIVKGEIPAEHAHLTLSYNKGNNTHIREEADVTGGKFIFRGTVDAPYKVSLSVRYSGAKVSGYDDHLEFFLDAGTTLIHTKDSLKNAAVSGTSLVRDGLAYDKPMTAMLAKLTAEYEERERTTPEAEKQTAAYKQAMAAIDDSFMVQQKRMDLAFIHAHPASRLDLYIFREQTYGWEYTELAPLFASLAPAVRESPAGKKYATRLERLKFVALGQPAPDFTHPDSTGKMISLSSFKGKYVLIDFWASWCGPCRGESPYLVAAYDRYKEKGFTIIGISLDKKAQRKAWLQAIQQDKLFWTQLSDLSDVNPVVQLYGVKGIPQNFLIDPDGRIIAHNLRGEKLDEKLAELMDAARTAAATQQALLDFSVSGKIGHYSAPYLAFLLYMSPNGYRKDSVVIKDGEFMFSGKIKSPRMAYLSIAKPGSDTNQPASFYLEQGLVKLESADSLSHLVVNGGTINEEYKTLQTLLQPVTDSLERARRGRTAQLISLRERLYALEMEYMQAYPDSWVSLWTMLEDHYKGRDLATYQAVFESFSPKLKASSVGVYLAPMIAIAAKTKTGAAAMDFTISDPGGHPHSLNEFRGKYVLVDFWASWCGPCRAENPNVLKAYNAFKEKGFTVIGISIDDAKDKDKWIEAIRKDGMPWTQLSELKGWEAPVAQQYGIVAIPQNFLLDTQGRIVAKGLRGEDLINKLNELMR